MQKEVDILDIQQFIAKLQKIPNSATVSNPYLNPVKAKNFSIYLTYMLQSKPKHLLVGEALGHLGGALSGIPFTDELRLTISEDKKYLPLQQNGYQIVSTTPHKEASATVIWESFLEKSYFPVLWNIFPIHPHEYDNPKSNRMPTAKEISMYSYFVTDLMELIPSINQVFALGRTAERKLNQMGIPASYIRHPSFGGVQKCRERIFEIAY